MKLKDASLTIFYTGFDFLKKTYASDVKNGGVLKRVAF